MKHSSYFSSLSYLLSISPGRQQSIFKRTAFLRPFSTQSQPPATRLRMPVQEMHEQRYDAEKEVKRNPHSDFNKVQASRPAFDRSKQWEYRQPPNPNWKLGDGANDGGECLKKEHIAIDPYAEGRPAVFNYKLLISAIVPRPIGFVSTLSKDGESSNLAPFSYTQMGMLDLE